MVRLGMCRVVFFRLPNFVEQKSSATICGAMQIVLEAAIFLARRSHQRAKLGLEKWFVTRSRPEKHNDRHAVLRQLCVIRCASAPRIASGWFT